MARIPHAWTTLAVVAALLCLAPRSSAEPAAGDLEAFVSRPIPVAPLMVQIIGASSRPEADAAAVSLAVARFEAQRDRIVALSPAIRSGVEAVVRDGPRGATRRKRLLKRVDAHEPLLTGGLEGASLRRVADTALKGPMHGGESLGSAFLGLGQLLAGQVVEALGGKRTEEVAQALVRLARFGALVADAALTLDELASGLRAAQDALGMLARLPDVAQLVCPSVSAETIRSVWRDLGQYGQELQSARRQLRAAEDLQAVVDIAVTSSSALWRHEALKVLRGVAWSGIGTTRGARAEALMTSIAANPSAPADVREAARREGTRLRLGR